MEFKKLQIRNFRNFTAQEIEFGENINVFVGDNGQGKTNILESLYLCSYGRSFRTSKLKHLVKNDCDESLIRASIIQNSVHHKLDIKLSKTEKSSVFLNEKKTSSSRLSEMFPVILFSPESLRSIKEGPEERRRLVDDMIILLQPGNAKILADFDKVHRTKSKLLRDYAAGEVSRTQTLAILESLQPQFLEKAVDVTMARVQGLRGLLNTFKNVFKSIINDLNVDISVDYVISDNAALHLDRTEVIDIMQNRTLDIGPRELESGLCLVGPHRHEISYLYNGNDSRFFCSQGQQRAIILSFKIAQVLLYHETCGTAPVLLLDDVLSELDSDRRDFLIRFLRENSAQTIVTTTDLAFCQDLRSEKLTEFYVKDNQVSRHQE